MSPRLHWFLPTSGDGRGIVSAGHAGGADDLAGAERRPDISYLAQVARAAEHLGFESVLTPTGTWCEDAWLVTAALARETTRLGFLVAFRPDSIAPTLAAQMAATFQRLSGGRLALNVVTGGDPAEQRRYGDFLTHDDRYARTAEFLTVVRGAWSGTPYDHDGAHYRVVGATVSAPPDPTPPIFFGGASPAAERVAAAHADTYLAWGEPPPMLATRLEGMRARATRPISFGVRLHVIARDTAADAWRVADGLLDRLDPAAIARAQEHFARSESHGQHRMAGLHGGRRDALTVYPNLWAGFGLVRGGAGTALVGSHDEVAARIAEYADLGVEHFILSGSPHLEEAYWVGEGVLPRVARPALTGADA